MGYEAILVIILWMILSLNAFINYAPLMKDLPPMDKVISCLVFMIGGPVFGMNQILMTLLELILPEGWDDDDPRL